jgi:pyruvate dehydrogenase E2 component (dihydrolipoamide acetyltransferase)
MATSATGTAARVLASPLARRLAAERGLDLGSLRGTGPHGRVRRRDVLAASASRPVSTVGRAPAASRHGETAEPLTPMRAGIAESVSLSRRTIPSFALDRWVETGAIEAARLAHGAAIEQATGIKPTATDFLLQAMADTLATLPAILDRFTEANGRPGRISPATVDIGLVVAVPGGMMIPVVRDLAGKSLGEIARLRQAAVLRVRAGRLVAADAEPVSISLSNLGRSGIDRFEAIVSPGQTSILAAGRQHERVVPRGGAIAIARGMNLTFSVDHRLIDGRAGAEFLALLADRIERGPWTA